MRTLKLGTPYLLPIEGDIFSVQSWLARHAPPLSRITFGVTPALAEMVDAIHSLDGKFMEYNLGIWLHRCARRYRLNPRCLLVRMQIEQGLLSLPDTEKLNPQFVALRFPPPSLGIADSVYMDKVGPLYVWGDRRLYAACGYGIPDAATKSTRDIHGYVGLTNQIAHCAKQYRLDLDRWKPGMTHTIYGGDTVEPEDAETYVHIKYTPSPKVLVAAAAIYARNFSS